MCEVRETDALNDEHGARGCARKPSLTIYIHQPGKLRNEGDVFADNVVLLTEGGVRRHEALHVLWTQNNQSKNPCARALSESTWMNFVVKQQQLETKSEEIVRASGVRQPYRADTAETRRIREHNTMEAARTMVTDGHNLLVGLALLCERVQHRLHGHAQIAEVGVHVRREELVLGRRQDNLPAHEEGGRKWEAIPVVAIQYTHRDTLEIRVDSWGVFQANSVLLNLQQLVHHGLVRPLG